DLRAALLVEQLAVPSEILGVVVEVALADAVGADAETQPVGNVAVVEPPGAVAQVMIVPQGDIAVAGMLEGAIPEQQVSRGLQAARRPREEPLQAAVGAGGPHRRDALDQLDFLRL